MAADDTPLMQQWREIKSRHQDALVLFRVGDFYEMFYEDAEEGARLLDLTLTSRNNGSSRAPLAGIPVPALETYLQRLVKLGRRVAICEQVEDPAQAKGIVRRAVTEMVTPGTALSEGLLDARRNNFLLAITGESDPSGELAVAWTDLSTGELGVQPSNWKELPDLLGRLEPSEILLPRSWELFPIPGADRVVCTHRSDWMFDAPSGEEELRRRFGVVTLEGFGFGPGDGLLVGATGALVAYLAETQPAAAGVLRPPRIERGGTEMQLDEMTRRNLELVEPLGSADGQTLLGVLDEALTPMGGRLLRRWLLSPLIDREAIVGRQDAVEELVDDTSMRRELRKELGSIKDLERLAVRVGSARCTPRDLLAIDASLSHVPALKSALAQARADVLARHREALDPLDDLRALVAAAISDDPPLNLADGGVIRPGFDPQLDELRSLREGAVEWIARLQAQERERTGIGSLKVGYNKVFGYYIEVTRTHLERVPEEYQRRQTLTNAERYITPELKEWEEKVLGAEEKILALESKLFEDVRRQVAALVPRLQELTSHVAALDVLAALAEVAVRREYVRPEVHDGYELVIRAGRHPVVETMMPREDFIPNDVRLDGEARIMILTGPNMAGKSTVLRQVGLIQLLAQVGSFVPAREARIGICDRIFTRVGASDNLVRGQSTFMVEMTETAAILNGASRRSLVLLDEIGRGTSTWDGMSVATAVTEYIHERVGAKTIFATHYHELTRLAERLPGVVNYSVAVKEDGENIVFLRSLVAGGADRSYGVEVARLAGLPVEVIGRARTLLRELEGGMANGSTRPAADVQLPLFEAQDHPVLERLRGVDVNRLTPIEAIVLLAELSAQARS
ncbi:MAG TPA: DNA mismatch repair protein MutS [Longimicrobiaceae bacterium]